MIPPEEELRRLVLIKYALWDARETLLERSERIDRDALGWFQRERLELAIEAERRLLQRREDLLLRISYEEEAGVLRCTPEEQRALVSLGVAILDGELQAQDALDELLADDFPRADRIAQGVDH